MKKTLLIAAMFGVLAVVSCKKSADTPDASGNTGSTSDLKVPAGFTWESSRNVTFNVAVSDTRFDTPSAKAIFKIEVYAADPNTGATAIAIGSASTGKPFSGVVYLPTSITKAYIKKTAPDKSSLTQKVDLTSTSVSLALGVTDATLAASSLAASKQVQATTPTSPDCNSGCTVTLTQSKSGLDMNSGDLICVTADNITIGLQNVNGGTLRICGNNVTVTGNLGGNGALIITAGHSATFTGNLNSGNASVTNFGTLTIPGNRADAGSFYNYGVATIGGDCNMNSSGSTFLNSGTLTINGGWQGGTSTTAINNGSMVVNNNFQTNGTPFINNCSLYVKNNYNQDRGTMQNYSLIKVDGQSTLNDNVELGLYNGAMFLTNNLIVNGKIIGYGSTSLVKITGTVGFQNGGSVINNVQVYATQDLSAYSNRITSGASTGNSVYIAKTGCNTVGNGTPAIVDADGDGVADNLDAYPNDPTKAYNVTGATGTLSFEDQWPAKGDFDMNDVVMTYQYALITNAANNVVQVTGNYSLIATGGTFGNAFAVEFPVSASSVSGLKLTNSAGTTSPSFEAGQSKAVVTLFTSMRSEMSTWNTRSTEAYATPKTYSITFNIADGTNVSAFGLDAYNPFIYNTTRGREIHLPGKTPTTLATASLFGTSDDNTSVSAGRYYVTKTGLPYAINIPVTFSYPTEGTDITKAYLHFADWAIAGGTTYTDWYSNLASGYRNTANIYAH